MEKVEKFFKIFTYRLVSNVFSRERHCSCPQKLLDALSHIPSYGILYAKNREFPRSEIQSANNPADAHGDIGGLSRCRGKMVPSGLCAKMNQNVQRPLAP